MATGARELYVFAHIPEAGEPRFVPAGILSLTEQESGTSSRSLASTFAYGSRYLERAAAIDVDPVSLPLGDRHAIRGQTLRPVNGLEEFGGVRDAAPDAWGRRVIEARMRAPANSLPEAEYLLQAGGDRVGALDVRTSISARDSSSASDLHSLSYILQAADAVEHGVPVPSALLDYLASGPSAGGARAKASVRDECGVLWLAKFPIRGDAFDVARVEICTLELARRCGIDVPELRWLDVGGRPVMLTRRFDRYWSGGGGEPHAAREFRLPFASGLTMVGSSEFESRTKSYADLARAIRVHGHPQRVQQDCLQLFTRMVLNIFVSNDDDHLRNHGFVRDPVAQGWVLGPAYDVVPRPGVARERMLHLQVGNEGRLATLDNALSQFSAFTPSRATALNVVRKVWGEVRQWKTCFEEHGAPGQVIDQVAPAFRKLEDIASPDLVAQIRNPLRAALERTERSQAHVDIDGVAPDVPPTGRGPGS